MKYFTLCFLLVSLTYSCVPLSEEEQDKNEVFDSLDREDDDVAVTNSEEFDEDLADELGADQYGMKRYVLANLIEGPNRDQDATTAALLQRAHLDNITRLAEAGKLVLAGPFLDKGAVRGIYIFNVETIEEARKLTATDPAIKAGRLKMELRPWYGSAALLKVNEIAKKVVKKKI